ncbi:uncharacterized protein LOC129292626 [Prosopis cineraria]|uniref:uncharacterized protein LOC129292626 n=1 Tax=Prosopis cineraria TaxID=364024 RepID=UPI00240EB6E9|nr:uncharacterized protein LOC129292626 [Prosopis cineraria]
MLGKNSIHKMSSSSFKKRSDKKKMAMRLLITVNVHGSALPLRFLVNDDDLVSEVIQTTLESCAGRERHPLLKFDAKDFYLYCPATLEDLSPTETIGSCGEREFVLINKNLNVAEKDDDTQKHKFFKGKKKVTKNLILVTVNVHGSAGPLRFLVKDDDLVSNVIQTTLKFYARQKRRPVLGFDDRDFYLYCPTKLKGLNPTETIGSCGARDFIMIKKNLDVADKDDDNHKHKLSMWKSCFVTEPKSVLT